MPQRKESTLIGVQSNFEMARWLWENHFAAVAGDMPGFEQAPLWEAEVQLHQVILGGWGMPIGELFDLEELARECKRLGRNTFFVSSVPLKVSVARLFCREECPDGYGVIGDWWRGESA